MVIKKIGTHPIYNFLCQNKIKASLQSAIVVVAILVSSVMADIYYTIPSCISGDISVTSGLWNIKFMSLASKNINIPTNATEWKFTGSGLVSDYYRGINNWLGWNFNTSIAGITGEGSDKFSKYTKDITAFTINPNVIFQVIKLKKVDIRVNILAGIYSFRSNFSTSAESKRSDRIKGFKNDFKTVGYTTGLTFAVKVFPWLAFSGGCSNVTLTGAYQDSQQINDFSKPSILNLNGDIVFGPLKKNVKIVLGFAQESSKPLFIDGKGEMNTSITSFG